MRRTQPWETTSDEELLDICRGGDTEAFAVLWERHSRAGFVAARGIAPSLDADDLVADAYLTIFELVSDGRGPTGAFRPYLYRVIRSVAADRFRSGDQSTVELQDAPELHETAPWEDNAFDLNAVAAAFATLSPRWQSALWYTEVEGLPPREAAVFLGLSPNSTSALVARARDALKSAWVEAHIDRELADGSCQFTLEHLQRYQRGKLTARLTREVESHLAACETCAAAAAESAALNRQLGLVLIWITLGGVGSASLAGELGLLGAAGGAAASVVTTGGAAGAAGGSTAGGSTAVAGSTAAGASAAGGAAASGGLVAGLGVPAAIATGTGLLAAAIAGITVVSLSFMNAGTIAPGEPETGVEASANGGDVDTAADSNEKEPNPTEDTQESQAATTSSAHERQRTSLRPTPPPVDPITNETAEDSVPDGPSIGPPVDPPVDPPVQPPVKPPVKPPVTPPESGNRWLRVGFECAHPGTGMRGTATRAGILQLRGSLPGEAPIELVAPQFDPELEGQPGNRFKDGVFKDGRGNSFTVGFFTGTDSDPRPSWWSIDPTALPSWATLFPGSELSDVHLEMRLITPGGYSSTWQPIDTSASCIS